MLAVNKITGMQFFEVTKAEAADQAAAKEIIISRKAGPDFIVDAHTHICTRKDGYIPGVNERHAPQCRAVTLCRHADISSSDAGHLRLSHRNGDTKRQAGS
jgi:hypothetical protein